MRQLYGRVFGVTTFGMDCLALYVVHVRSDAHSAASVPCKHCGVIKEPSIEPPALRQTARTPSWDSGDYSVPVAIRAAFLSSFAKYQASGADNSMVPTWLRGPRSM